MSAEEVPQQYVIELGDVEAIVAWHNVVGKQGVLCASTEELEQVVGEHYAARAIDHIPYTANGHIERFVLTTEPEMLGEQLDYRGQLSGLDFYPIRNLKELAERGITKALFVPYINLTSQKFPAEMAWETYGLPPEVTGALKDKADLHEWLMANGFEQHTPNYVISTANQIVENGLMMLPKIAEMYREFGVSDMYPLGLMIRGAHSDGNYGMASLRQAVRSESIDGCNVYKGEIILRRDGSAVVEFFDRWEDALQRAQDHISLNTPENGEYRVVMSRLIDLRMSPGLSAAIIGQEVYPFNFNGQYTEPGQTACVGTSTFKISYGEKTASRTSEDYLTQSQNILKRIMKHFLADKGHVNAMMNIDLMLTGMLEQMLWERARSSVFRRYKENVGCCNADYEPRVYSTSDVLIAEINPRDTNWTLAMKAVLQARNMPCTIENLQILANGTGIKVVARDKWDVPETVDWTTARTVLYDYHKRLAENGEGFILRMADRPAGVIMYTESEDPHRLSEISYEAYQLLQTLVPA